MLGSSTPSVWPSAFRYVEWPFYNENTKRNELLRDRDVIPVSESSDIPFLKMGLWWPIMMCSLPLTSLADIATGIFQAGLVKYRGRSTKLAKSILYKKVVASPLQHLIFAGVNLIIPTLGANLVLSQIFYGNRRRAWNILSLKGSKGDYGLLMLCAVGMGSLVSPIFYNLAQQAVGKSPRWVHPNRFFIFMDGGALDPRGKKLTDEDYVERLGTYRAQREEQTNPLEKSWEDYVKDNKGDLQRKPGATSSFDIFINNFLDAKSPLDLLLVLKPNFTETELKKAYLRWATVVHPDRQKGPKETCDILFRALQEACCRLEEVLKNRR